MMQITMLSIAAATLTNAADGVLNPQGQIVAVTHGLRDIAAMFNPDMYYNEKYREQMKQKVQHNLAQLQASIKSDADGSKMTHDALIKVEAMIAAGLKNVTPKLDQAKEKLTKMRADAFKEIEDEVAHHTEDEATAAKEKAAVTKDCDGLTKLAEDVAAESKKTLEDGQKKLATYTEGSDALKKLQQMIVQARASTADALQHEISDIQKIEELVKKHPEEFKRPQYNPYGMGPGPEMSAHAAQHADAQK